MADIQNLHHCHRHYKHGTIKYGNLVVNRFSFEHYLWTNCVEIENLRKEIKLNPQYSIVNQDVEKYIKDLLRFFVLKLHHRDYNTGDDDKFEDTIVPFNNHLDSIWVLFSSHYDEYSSFMKRISVHILNGEEIVLKRNYSTLMQNMKSKIDISRLHYKNRYGSLPDIELNSAIVKRFGGLEYWQGTYYNNGLCKHGILVYCLNNHDGFHHFIGTLAENENNEIESGTLFFTDGRTQDFREGEWLNDPDHPSDNQTNSHEDDDSSVATFTE